MVSPSEEASLLSYIKLHSYIKITAEVDFFFYTDFNALPIGTQSQNQQRTEKKCCN